MTDEKSTIQILRDQVDSLNAEILKYKKSEDNKECNKNSLNIEKEEAASTRRSESKGKAVTSPTVGFLNNVDESTIKNLGREFAILVAVLLTFNLVTAFSLDGIVTFWFFIIGLVFIWIRYQISRIE